MAARDDENDGGQPQPAVVDDQRFDVAGQMVHRHERHVERGGQALGERDPYEQGPDEARTLRDRDRVELRPRCLAVVESTLHDAADVADVLAGGELGDDATPFPVNVRLRGDRVRPHAPRPILVAGLRNDRRRGLVARRLDGQHRRHQRASPSPQAARRLSPYGG